MRPLPRPATLGVALLASALASVAAAQSPTPPAAPAATPPGYAPLASLAAHRVVPAPASVTPAEGAPFALTAATAVVVPAGDTGAARVGDALARLLRPATGFPLPVRASDAAAPAGALVLRLGGPAALGREGYELDVSADSVRVTAAAPAGLFYGVQTIRQLLPAAIEASQRAIRSPGVTLRWTIPPGRVSDRPRFAWRGGMLDVSRHFFTVREVKQYADLLALYKFNTMHLHLSDDQGWRVQIDARPRLTTVGARTQVGGGPGGFYTKADYREIVRYAGERFLTVVPEFDMPAHTQAAIAAYPELGCGKAVPDTLAHAPAAGAYTGVQVGFSALCHDREATYRFVDDVVREVAEMTPGPYFHLGGDEVAVLNHAQYARFIERTQEIVARHGKTAVGWDEIGRARLRPGTIGQVWRPDSSAFAALRQGAKLIMSPATKSYLDMKYTPATAIGHRWAAFIELRTAYDWDPATFAPGLTEQNVLGVEAALWTETVPNITAAQFLLVPRLPAVAEVGWSAAGAKGWEGFRTRIAGHAPRWQLLGVNYYASPQVAWD